MGAFNTKYLQIARRYALALIKFEHRDSILSDLQKVCETLNSSEDLKIFLKSPIITNIDKNDIIHQVFSFCCEEVINLLCMLVERNRFDCLETIVIVLQQELDKHHNLVRVEVISAVEMSASEKDDLLDKLQRKMSCSVVPDYKIDESVIAGLVIKIGDKIIDNSLKGRLESLRRQLI